MATINLPKAPKTNEVTVGKSYFLKVAKLDDQNKVVWVKVGGQRNSGITKNSESIDASHKTSGGWKSTLPGMLSWGTERDGLMMLNDEGVAIVELAFNQNELVAVMFEYPDGTHEVGWAAVTEFSIDTPHDDVASLTGSLEGNGPLSERTTEEVDIYNIGKSVAAPAVAPLAAPKVATPK